MIEMYEEIKTLKDQINAKRNDLKTRYKRIEDDISNHEKILSLKIAEFNKNVINSFFDNLYSVRESIEKWDSLKFDGYRINHNLGTIMLFITDNNFYSYDIMYENGEFVINGTAKGELQEDINLILEDLNSSLNNY